MTLLNLKVVTTCAKALVETLAEKPNRVIFSGKPAKLSHPRRKFKKLQARAGHKTIAVAASLCDASSSAMPQPDLVNPVSGRKGFRSHARDKSQSYLSEVSSLP